MRQSLIFIPNFFGSWIQSCTKLVGTHALIIIITFVIKMYVYKMTCMIQYPCSKHASSPSLPHQAMLVYTCLSFIPSALSSTTLILGSGEQSFYTKCPNSFVQDCSKIGLAALLAYTMQGIFLHWKDENGRRSHVMSHVSGGINSTILLACPKEFWAKVCFLFSQTKKKKKNKTKKKKTLLVSEIWLLNLTSMHGKIHHISLPHAWTIIFKWISSVWKLLDAIWNSPPLSLQYIGPGYWVNLLLSMLRAGA